VTTSLARSRWVSHRRYLDKHKGEEMGKSKRGFGGKKAAPFKKGGGRSTNSPRTAKGTPRKR
jgi:hypothetical protein